MILVPFMISMNEQWLERNAFIICLSLSLVVLIHYHHVPTTKLNSACVYIYFHLIRRSNAMHSLIPLHHLHIYSLRNIHLVLTYYNVFYMESYCISFSTAAFPSFYPIHQNISHYLTKSPISRPQFLFFPSVLLWWASFFFATIFTLFLFLPP